MRADRLICAVPTYGGHANGLYRSFLERMQMMGSEFQKTHFLCKTKALIIIGNPQAGGDQTLREIFADFQNQISQPEKLLLSAQAFDKRALNGDLIDVSAVKTRLDSLITKLFS
ncbi:MAG: hypothetical protein EHM45_18870 [Desulfobacteraceae bacterium]|nr:MAG: hypothetical protein EHM45_18870 [Desulfobacteraceae bacterium]